jgi:hypothetical protein
MTRILKKTAGGEPQPRSLKNSWGYRPGRNSIRNRLSIRTLRKTPVEDAVMAGIETTSVNTAGTIKVTAGTVLPGTQARGRVVRKVQRLTTKQAKGTKVIAPPSPTNRGGTRSPYGKNKI